GMIIATSRFPAHILGGMPEVGSLPPSLISPSAYLAQGRILRHLIPVSTLEGEPSILRALTCTLALAFLMSGLCLAGGQKAQDKDKNTGQEQKATITKLDAKNHSITLKMRDRSGKEAERNFKLTEDIQYVDSTGKVATVDVFRSGDD